MMSNDLQDRLTRVILRHGEEAARDCIEFALDLAESEGVEKSRIYANAFIDGGRLPEPEPEPEPGRPGVPDSGLMAAWAAVTIVMEQHDVSILAACKWLCRKKGTRRNPEPTGIVLNRDGKLWHWDNTETLRGLYKIACKRREQDEDFKTVSDLCLPALREQLLGQ